MDPHRYVRIYKTNADLMAHLDISSISRRENSSIAMGENKLASSGKGRAFLKLERNHKETDQIIKMKFCKRKELPARNRLCKSPITREQKRGPKVEAINEAQSVSSVQPLWPLNDAND